MSDDPRRRLIAVLTAIELAHDSGNALTAAAFLRLAELVDPDFYHQVALDLLDRRIPHPGDSDLWLAYVAQHRWPPHPTC